MSRAARRWAGALAAWAIPPEILAAAPEDPWAYRVAHFVRLAEEAMVRDTPSYRQALEAMVPGGSVLDVGCGAGAASLPLAPPAALLVGVDSSPQMLEAFAERAGAIGVAHREILGRWPEVAGAAPMADVVVCHHVLYNVADLEPFVRALDGHARRRVVIELTAEHPRAWQGPLWRALHRIERPLGPTADDAIAVFAEMGIQASVRRWSRAAPFASTSLVELVPVVRVDLCLPAERDVELARALAAHPPPAERGVVTLWWDPPASG